MSSFAGVSVVNEGKYRTEFSTDTDSGYHLLVVKNYKCTVEERPNEHEITSDTFMVGGRNWQIDYFPNGCEPSCADFICLQLFLIDDDDEDIEDPAEFKYQFSFIDQVEYQKPVHIRATETYRLYGGTLSRHKFIKRDALERSTHLKDDCFTIRCDIMVCKHPNTRDASGTMSDIGQNLDYLLQNKLGTDVIFEVSGETFTAHRCVLAARSTVFMAQLFGPMKEGTTSSVIQIQDMEAKMFRALLSFIYTGSFPKMDKDKNMKEDKEEVVEEGKEEGAVEYIMWLHDLLVAADRYDLQRLKLLCEENLSEHIDMNSVAPTLALAEQHHCHSLRETCFKFIQVQSPNCLGKIMATDGWKEITMTYPSVLNELIAKLVSNQIKDKKSRQ